MATSLWLYGKTTKDRTDSKVIPSGDMSAATSRSLCIDFQAAAKHVDKGTYLRASDGLTIGSNISGQHLGN